jgi:hypothetical protein
MASPYGRRISAQLIRLRKKPLKMAVLEQSKFAINAFNKIRTAPDHFNIVAREAAPDPDSSLLKREQLLLRPPIR